MPQEAWVDRFIRDRSLPEDWHDRAGVHFDVLAEWLSQSAEPGRRLLGISGAQGTGKSSLAEYLREALERTHGKRTCILSLDDFYRTKAERRVLADTVHPLLATRGVPGTHDIARLTSTIRELLEGSASVRLPVFDKGLDDRSPQDRPAPAEPDFLLLEGWCIGARAQTARELAEPINALEAQRDPDGRWRQWVNEQLARDYAPLFDSLDALLLLKPPGFESVLGWRTLQEHKLIAATGRGMTDAEVTEFISHYERLTRVCIDTLPAVADVVIELDDDHGIGSLAIRGA